MRGPFVEQAPQDFVGERPAIDEARVCRDHGRQQRLERALEQRAVVRVQHAERRLVDVGMAVPFVRELARSCQQRFGFARRDDFENRGADLLVAFGARVELHREEVALVERAARREQIVDALRTQRPHPHAADGVGAFAR